MAKKIVSYTILIIGVILIINLSRDIFRLLKSGERVKLAQQKLEQVEKENQQLQKKRQESLSPEFIEQEARNKLNMTKPGETVVILPPNIEGLLGKSKQEVLPETPNWKKWWRLFF